MKRRIILAAVLFLSAALSFLPVIVMILHQYLSTQTVSRFRYMDCWSVIFFEQKALLMYCIFAALLCLIFLYWMISPSSLSCYSNMQRITPQIAIPVAAGQGQFGTAHFMPDGLKSRSFTVWHIKHSAIRHLLDEGKKDREEIKHAHIDIA